MEKLLITATFLLLLSLKPLFAGVDNGIDVEEVQKLLAELCFDPGPIDGVWGKKTENAAKQFLKGQKKTFSGTFTKDHENTLWGVLNSRKIQASFGTGSVTLCEVNQSGGVASKGDGSDQANKRVTIYESWSIPQYVKPDPNLATLRHYFLKDYSLISDTDLGWYRVKPANNHKKFKQTLRESNFLKNELETSSLLSYLYFEDGAIIYDEKSPKHRLGDLYRDNTPFLSNSVGKSISSYILGHAICKGYISGLDARLDDWALIENTLYYDQKLLDIVNMNAGDKRVVNDATGLIGTDRWYNTHSLRSFAERELSGSKALSKSRRKHHYNGLATNVFLNYVVHKTNYRFRNLLNEIFREHVNVQHTVYFGKQRYARTDNGRIVLSSPVSPKDGVSTYGMYATRYDYLRIANAMLDDWKNDTCVGQYLKSLAANKIPQKRFIEKHKGNRFSAKSYAGQFHMDYLHLEGRNIFGMNGYGGQTIMIDFDENRIIAISTVHTDYDFEGLVLKPLRNGRIQ